MFSIANYGAATSATAAANRMAISMAVAAAKAAGGGVVDVPSGTWPTGAIQLDSNIELHLESGAILSFSTSTTDYQPAVLTRWEGLDVMNWSPMVYALGATNVAITGSGTLQGPGETWGGGVPNWKSGSSSEDQRIYTWWLSHLTGLSGPPAASQVPTSMVSNGLRPTFVECNGCTNFLMDGPKVIGGIYWNIHPLYSKNVIIRNLNVDSTGSSSNGDGTDPDSCDTCLVDNVTYATSDDPIAVKSGLNEVGIAVGRPTHNLIARNVKVAAGHAFSIGSEMSGGVNNVFLTADTMNSWNGVQYVFRIKTLAGRGGAIHDIFFENTSGTASKNALLITTNYGSSTIPPHDTSLLPTVKNVTFANVSGSQGVSLTGLASAPLQNIVFNNVNVTGTSSCAHVASMTLTGSSIGLTGTSCL
jgi:polygalacturonase